MLHFNSHSCESHPGRCQFVSVSVRQSISPSIRQSVGSSVRQYGLPFVSRSVFSFSIAILTELISCYGNFTRKVAGLLVFRISVQLITHFFGSCPKGQSSAARNHSSQAWNEPTGLNSAPVISPVITPVISSVISPLKPKFSPNRLEMSTQRLDHPLKA